MIINNMEQFQQLYAPMRRNILLFVWYNNMTKSNTLVAEILKRTGINLQIPLKELCDIVIAQINGNNMQEKYDSLSRQWNDCKNEGFKV